MHESAQRDQDLEQRGDGDSGLHGADDDGVRRERGQQRLHLRHVDEPERERGAERDRQRRRLGRQVDHLQRFRCADDLVHDGQRGDGNVPLVNTQGTTTVSFHAIDNANNTESPDQTFVVKIDKAAPSIVASATKADATTYPPGRGRIRT